MKGTKNKLISAAIETWSKDPNASLDEISLNSGISRRTLHRHFDGRNELLATVLNRLVNEYLETIEQITDQNEPVQTRLHKLFINDVTTSDKYFLYKNLSSNQSSNHNELKTKLQTLYSMYHLTFYNLMEEQLIRPYSKEWLESFYSACVQATVNMYNRENNEHTIMTGWQLFWNALKS